MNEDFEQLAGRAAEVDAANEPMMTPIEGGIVATEAEPPVDYYRESRGAVDFFAALIVGYCPSCADVWDSGTKERVSAALAPVMEKYGVTLGALPPELTLLIVAGPPLYQSSRLVAEHTQRKREEAERQRQEAAAKNPAGPYAAGKPDGSPESPDMLVHPQMGLYQK